MGKKKGGKEGQERAREENKRKIISSKGNKAKEREQAQDQSKDMKIQEKTRPK